MQLSSINCMNSSYIHDFKKSYAVTESEMILMPPFHCCKVKVVSVQCTYMKCQGILCQDVSCLVSSGSSNADLILSLGGLV